MTDNNNPSLFNSLKNYIREDKQKGLENKCKTLEKSLNNIKNQDNRNKCRLNFVSGVKNLFKEGNKGNVRNNIDIFKSAIDGSIEILTLPKNSKSTDNIKTTLKNIGGLLLEAFNEKYSTTSRSSSISADSNIPLSHQKIGGLVFPKKNSKAQPQYRAKATKITEASLQNVVSVTAPIQPISPVSQQLRSTNNNNIVVKNKDTELGNNGEGLDIASVNSVKTTDKKILEDFTDVSSQGLTDTEKSSSDGNISDYNSTYESNIRTERVSKELEDKIIEVENDVSAQNYTDSNADVKTEKIETNFDVSSQNLTIEEPEMLSKQVFTNNSTEEVEQKKVLDVDNVEGTYNEIRKNKHSDPVAGSQENNSSRKEQGSSDEKQQEWQKKSLDTNLHTGNLPHLKIEQAEIEPIQHRKEDLLTEKSNKGAGINGSSVSAKITTEKKQIDNLSPKKKLDTLLPSPSTSDTKRNRYPIEEAENSQKEHETTEEEPREQDPNIPALTLDSSTEPSDGEPNEGQADHSDEDVLRYKELDIVIESTPELKNIIETTSEPEIVIEGMGQEKAKINIEQQENSLSDLATLIRDLKAESWNAFKLDDKDNISVNDDVFKNKIPDQAVSRILSNAEYEIGKDGKSTVRLGKAEYATYEKLSPEQQELVKKGIEVNIEFAQFKKNKIEGTFTEYESNRSKQQGSTQQEFMQQETKQQNNFSNTQLQANRTVTKDNSKIPQSWNKDKFITKEDANLYSVLITEFRKIEGIEIDMDSKVKLFDKAYNEEAIKQHGHTGEKDSKKVFHDAVNESKKPFYKYKNALSDLITDLHDKSKSEGGCEEYKKNIKGQEKEMSQIKTVLATATEKLAASSVGKAGVVGWYNKVKNYINGSKDDLVKDFQTDIKDAIKDGASMSEINKIFNNNQNDIFELEGENKGRFDQIKKIINQGLKVEATLKNQNDQLLKKEEVITNKTKKIDSKKDIIEECKESIDENKRNDIFKDPKELARAGAVRDIRKHYKTRDRTHTEHLPTNDKANSRFEDMERDAEEKKGKQKTTQGNDNSFVNKIEQQKNTEKNNGRS